MLAADLTLAEVAGLLLDVANDDRPHNAVGDIEFRLDGLSSRLRELHRIVDGGTPPDRDEDALLLSESGEVVDITDCGI
jgi:hypothetical protein